MADFGIYMIMFTALAVVTQIHIHIDDREEEE